MEKGNQFNFTKKKVQNKSFWIVLVLVFAFSLSVIVVNFNNYSDLTGKSVQVVNLGKEGGVVPLNTKINGVNSIKINFIDATKNDKVVTEELDVNDLDIEGIFYSRFVISSSDEDKIGNVEIDFKLNNEKLSELKITVPQLYQDGKELGLEFIRKDETHTYYQSIGGMGEFLIGELKETPKVIEKEVQQPKKIVVPEPEPFIPEPIAKKTQTIKEESWWDDFKGWFTS